jgi:hypothetical protein
MFESNKYDEEISPGFSPAQGIVKGISSFCSLLAFKDQGVTETYFFYFFGGDIVLCDMST